FLLLKPNNRGGTPPLTRSELLHGLRHQLEQLVEWGLLDLRQPLTGARLGKALVHGAEVAVIMGSEALGKLANGGVAVLPAIPHPVPRIVREVPEERAGA